MTLFSREVTPGNSRIALPGQRLLNLLPCENMPREKITMLRGRTTTIRLYAAYHDEECGESPLHDDPRNIIEMLLLEGFRRPA